jgi:hypothetical protein
MNVATLRQSIFIGIETLILNEGAKVDAEEI